MPIEDMGKVSPVIPTPESATSTSTASPADLTETVTAPESELSGTAPMGTRGSTRVGLRLALASEKPLRCKGFSS